MASRPRQNDGTEVLREALRRVQERQHEMLRQLTAVQEEESDLREKLRRVQERQNNIVPQLRIMHEEDVHRRTAEIAQIRMMAEEDVDMRTAEIAQMRQNCADMQAALDRNAHALSRLQNEVQDTFAHLIARIEEGQQDQDLVRRIGTALLNVADGNEGPAQKTEDAD